MYRLGMARKLQPCAFVQLAESTSAKRTQVNVFGTARARNWFIPEDGSEKELLAAQLQHRIAVQIRGAITQSDAGNPAEFARRHDELTYARLRGVLSGSLWMRMDDLSGIAHLLGLVPVVTLELEPEEQA